MNMIRNYEAPHCTVFSGFVLLPPY
jgi:hypothetical protein